eukprot:g5565.t1
MMIRAASCGSRHTLLVDTGGTLWSFGWGKFGQLGHGARHSVRRPAQLDALRGRRVLAASAGGCHSAAIVAMPGDSDAMAATPAGHVFTWGDGRQGQLGQGSAVSEIVLVPRRVGPRGSLKGADAGAGAGAGASSGEIAGAVQVSCGGQHTLALTRGGDVLAWGRGDSGQLGVGRGPFHVQEQEGAEPQQLQADAAADARSPGGDAAASALSASIGDATAPLPSYNAFSPLRQQPWRGAAIACGAFHSAAVGARGDVMTWGSENHGMLGYVTTRMDQWLPRRVSPSALDHQPVASVACGGWHTVAVTRRGVVFVWGRGEYGRLGLGDARSRQLPQRLSWPATVSAGAQVRVQQVSAGGTHTLFLLEDGRVFACGRAEHGRLGCGVGEHGHGRVEAGVCVPQPAALTNAFLVSCGGAHSLALAAEPGMPPLELPVASAAAD